MIMINTETISFIGFLNKLAEMSKHGIYPYSTATKKQKECAIIYDDRMKKYDCVEGYEVIADVIDNTIVSTYGSIYDSENIVIRVTMPDDETTWVSVTSRYDPNFDVVVMNGWWKTC